MTRQEEKLQIDLIRNVLQKKNYKFFSNGIYNLNIIGIRGELRNAGKFDDWICLIFKDKSGELCCKQWKITTDAGTFWLQNPMNEKGTALLKEGQYLSTYQIGMHKGRYGALVQIAPVTVYRDNNKDKIEDFNEATIETGMFGINIHRSNPVCESVINSKWSAGCQVFANPRDYDEFMSLTRKSSAIFGDKFTYTLLSSSDFNEL